MTRKARLTFGVLITLLCLASACVGTVLLVVAHGMPAHIDERRAAQLTEQYERNFISQITAQREPIEREMESLRTSKWKLYHAGLVTCLVSSLLLLAWLRFRLWDIGNLGAAETPRTRLSLLALASGAWLALLPALQLGANDDYAQDDLTPHIDTGNGTILVLGSPLFVLMLVVILLVGRFLVLRRVSMPANLWCWDRSLENRSQVLTSIHALFAIAIVFIFLWSTVNFPWALPSLMIGFYVILSSRAAAVNAVKQT